MGLSAHTFVLASNHRILDPVRFLSVLELLLPPSRQEALSHLGSRVCAHRLRCRPLPCGDIGSMSFACDRPSVLTSRRTLGQRIAPLYSNRENRHLAVTSSRSHLLQRTTFGRARDAGSRGRELIAQPSFTTSRPRRCSFVSPRPSTPCGMKSSVLTTSATVRARSRAQEAAHLSMFSTLHASSCTHRCPKPRKLARSPFG